MTKMSIDMIVYREEYHEMCDWDQMRGQQELDCLRRCHTYQGLLLQTKQGDKHDKGSQSKQYEWWTSLLKRLTWCWTDMTKILKKRDGDESILSKWQQRRRRLKRWRGGGWPPAEPLPTTSHVTLSMTMSLSSSSPPSSSSSSFSSLLMSTFWFVCRNAFAS